MEKKSIRWVWIASYSLPSIDARTMGELYSCHCLAVPNLDSCHHRYSFPTTFTSPCCGRERVFLDEVVLGTGYRVCTVSWAFMVAFRVDELWVRIYYLTDLPESDQITPTYTPYKREYCVRTVWA